ncbi:uncharacterized protein PV07_05451 [Cladophialophora immunda]|uniref:PHD-type domain-containing protein n=1 Tax=Cladophialophora immunda TaxID=569365 RepID=A0A0D2CEW3_9EURO|nr:uncharacterized protein PV07_05451 [Cladophialophora immunda]KIW29653.1 hypothetical protein PV07_05451 [Cladophialophora immunda]OQU94731.1 hypothetical protein CLAIMM_01044 [Cladophialophora immunda]
MATRSLRHRSSRYSSPATFGEKEAAPKPAEDLLTRNGQQTSLDKWIEPTVRPAVPSFEDTKGLERVGVLENMQPLGTAPSQRLLQKLKLNYVRPSPRPAPAQVEEVVTPVAEPEKVDSASPLEEDVAVTTATIEAEQPEILSDIPPNHPPPSDTIVISSPPRGRPPRRDIAEMPQATTVSPSPATLSLTPTTHVSPKPLSIQQQLRQDRLRTHIDRAVQEAHQKNTPDLVRGLQRICDDAQLNPELWNVLEALVNKSPSSEQFKIFKRYIKSGVKQHRRESQMSASPYQHSPQIFNDLASPEHRDRSPKPHHSDANAPLYSEERPRRINLYFNLPRAAAAYGSEEAPVSPSTILRSVDVAEPGGKSIHHASNSSPHKRKRSGSVSTISSLSSAPSIPDEIPPPWEPHGDEPAGGGRSRSAGQRQAASRAAAGNRLRSAASATTLPSHAAPKQSFPEVATSSRTSSNKKFKKSREETEFDIDELSRRKRLYLDDSFHDYNTIPRPESHERDPVHSHPVRPTSIDNPPPPVIHPNRLVVPTATLTSPVSAQAPPENTLANGTGRKRRYDELDVDDFEDTTPDSSSPGPLLVPPPPPGVANAHPRGATPRSTRLHPAQKTRKSARVMVSPNKPKNGGITAGIARAGPRRDAGIGNLNGADSGAEDNDEFCASCGGEGKLLCCDGCTNSFHHACLEPPLNPDEEVEGEWFCPRCVGRRTKQVPHPSGLFGMVIRRVDDIIPKAYTLPSDIRDYFEGVRTGDEGEYEEVGLPRTQNNTAKMNRAGFIEEPNYKETRDSKGHIIRCYRCDMTANGRDIIPCDFCPARWHLDCIDPPLAVPPRRRPGDKPGASWRCPLHVEHDLVAVGRQSEKAPGELGRVPRLRKPKNAVPLDVSVTRGFRNNGIIEVDLMKDEPELDKTKEVQMHGKIYRIPEMGIRLDFIDRVKKSWYEDQSFPRQMDAPKRIRNRKYRPDGAVLHHPPQQTIVKIREPDFFTGANALAITETAKANVALRRRSIREQQTVLNLAEMSQRGIDGYSGDALAELTNQLISEAPSDVVNAVEKTELDQLLELQELINRRLAFLGHATNTSRSISMDAESFDGSFTGDELPPTQDPNIDPTLRILPLDRLPTSTPPSADDDLPIDPALHMASVDDLSNPKMTNGDTVEVHEIESDDDDDDEEEEEEARPAPVDEAAARRRAKEEADQRWLDAFFPLRTETPARYNGPTNTAAQGFGNRNSIDRMETSP